MSEELFFNTKKDRDRYYFSIEINDYSVNKVEKNITKQTKQYYKPKPKCKTGDILKLNYKNDYSQKKHINEYGSSLGKTIRTALKNSSKWS